MVHRCVLNFGNFHQTILLLKLANMNNNCIHICELFLMRYATGGSGAQTTKIPLKINNV